MPLSLAPEPEITAELYLYATADGGRRSPIRNRIRCPCFAEKDTSTGGWDCMILLEGELSPGDKRTVGFAFLSGERAVNALTSAGKFYVWDGGFFGEAIVNPAFKRR